MVSIRPAVVEDAALIVRLIRELAAFEKARPEQVRVREEDVRRWGFGPERVFEALLAEENGEGLGFALFFRNYSTWEGQPGLYLEDLFVPERHRGRGIGFALLREVARTAVARGCPRVDWAVLDWNPAREFYRRIGAVELEEWRVCRLTGAALKELAVAEAP